MVQTPFRSLEERILSAITKGTALITIIVWFTTWILPYIDRWIMTAITGVTGGYR